MAELLNDLHHEASHEVVLVCPFTRHNMSKDHLACIAANNKAFDYVALIAGLIELLPTLPGLNTSCPSSSEEAAGGHVEVVNAYDGHTVLPSGMSAASCT